MQTSKFRSFQGSTYYNNESYSGPRKLDDQWVASTTPVSPINRATNCTQDIGSFKNKTPILENI